VQRELGAGSVEEAAEIDVVGALGDRRPQHRKIGVVLRGVDHRVAAGDGGPHCGGVGGVKADGACSPAAGCRGLRGGGEAIVRDDHLCDIRGSQQIGQRHPAHGPCADQGYAHRSAIPFSFPDDQRSTWNRGSPGAN